MRIGFLPIQACLGAPRRVDEHPRRLGHLRDLDIFIERMRLGDIARAEDDGGDAADHHLGRIRSIGHAFRRGIDAMSAAGISYSTLGTPFSWRDLVDALAVISPAPPTSPAAP